MLMMEILIKQLENQTINIENNNIQKINIEESTAQEININKLNPQDLNIKQKENQIIYIEGNGTATGINDVLVNGVSVVSDGIAYIITPTKTSELINNSGYITHEEDPTVASYIKAISLADINNWNSKQDELVSGSNIKTINNTSLLGNGNINIDGTIYTAGTGININESNVISNTIVSYNDLEDLPEIPTATSELQNDSDYVSSNELADVAFSGSYIDLSDTPEIPDSTSELINDSGYIDKNVNDLTYYTPTTNLGAVALSNSYNDLSNKPTIPTKTSDLNNDSGFINSIKTVNNNSLIGSGNVNINSNITTIWSGNLYNTTDTINNLSFENNKIYIFKVKGLSGSYFEYIFYLSTGGYDYVQHTLYDGNTVARWRIDITATSFKLNNGCINLGSNTAVVGLYKLD